MDSTTFTRQIKFQKWSEIIQAQKDSGLTVTEFCDKNSIAKGKYYYWLKRIRQTACDNLPTISNSNIVPVIPCDDFVTGDAQISPSVYAMRLSVNGISLEFSNEASTSLIENALRVINYAR